MTIASRISAGLAAIALILAGLVAVAPSPAQAQGAKVTSTALLIGGAITAAVVTTLVLLGNNDDENDDEGPQSP